MPGIATSITYLQALEFHIQVHISLWVKGVIPDPAQEALIHVYDITE